MLNRKAGVLEGTPALMPATSPHAMRKCHGVGMVLDQVAFQVPSRARVQGLWLLHGVSIR